MKKNAYWWEIDEKLSPIGEQPFPKNSDFVVANHSEVLGNEKTKLAIITKKDTIWIEDTKINASKSILKEISKKI